MIGIKTLDNVTLGDFERMERTGKISQYSYWWNPIPVRLQVKSIQKLIIEIQKYIDDNKLNVDVSGKEWESLSANKITRLDSSLKIVYLNLVTKVELKQTLSKIKLNRRQRRKATIKDNAESLKDALQTIKEITGYEIDSELNGYEKASNELTRLVDKYNENFRKKEDNSPVEAKPIMSIAAKYLSFFELSTIGANKMTIIEFKMLKDNVLEKIKEIEKQKNKR